MSEKQEQQNTERSRMLGTMEMRKLVPTVSVPIMVSMLVQALYNIVDGIFVGQYSPDALFFQNSNPELPLPYSASHLLHPHSKCRL